jgi:hypothetical protein
LLIRYDFEALIAGDEEDELTAEQVHVLTHNLGQCGGTDYVAPTISIPDIDTSNIIIFDDVDPVFKIDEE